MKKGIIILILVLLARGNTGNAWAEESDWKESYKTLLETIEQEKLQNSNYMDTMFSYSYLLYDIDQNKIPELLLVVEGSEVDVFTFNCEDTILAGKITTNYVAFFDAPTENGVIINQRDSVHTIGWKCALKDGVASFDLLYEDNLEERRKEESNAQMLPITAYIPEARYLHQFDLKSRIAIDRYDEIQELIGMSFPKSENCYFPEYDNTFFDRLITENKPVYAASVDRYGNNPGFVSFCDLLKKDVADTHMIGDLEIVAVQTADLNGDGKLECVLDLSDGGNFPVRFFISEQDGNIYVYIQSMAMDNLMVDKYGTLISSDDISLDKQFLRLVFDKGESFLLIIPYSYTPVFE